MSILGHQKTDPILLTAICTFAIDLFECDELRYDEENMREFSNTIRDLQHLLPYLGFDMYDELLAMTGRYYSKEPGKQKKDAQIAKNAKKGDLDVSRGVNHEK